MKKDEKKLRVEKVTELRPEEVEFASHLRRRAELDAIRGDLWRPQNWTARLALREPEKNPEDVYKELQERRAKLEQEEHEYIERKSLNREKLKNLSGESLKQSPSHGRYFGNHQAPFQSPQDPSLPPPFPQTPQEPPYRRILQSGSASLFGLRYSAVLLTQNPQTEIFGYWTPVPYSYEYHFFAEFKVGIRTGAWTDHSIRDFIVEFDIPESQERSWTFWGAYVDVKFQSYISLLDKGFISVCCIHSTKTQVDLEDDEPPYNYEYKCESPALTCSTGYGSDDDNCRHQYFSNTYQVGGNLINPEESLVRIYLGMRVNLYAGEARTEVYDGEFGIRHVGYTCYPLD